MGGGEQGMETKFPDREQIESFIEFLSAGKLSEATNLLAEIAAIQPDNAARIISDAMGEPLSIALKAIGTNRARLVKSSNPREFRPVPSCRSQYSRTAEHFDSCLQQGLRTSTYWDWAVLKSGPTPRQTELSLAMLVLTDHGDEGNEYSSMFHKPAVILVIKSCI
jgi:hypothetical protein